MSMDTKAVLSQDLLPCPFCGGEDVEYSEAAEHCECNECWAIGPIGDEKGKAAIIAAWNRRASLRAALAEGTEPVGYFKQNPSGIWDQYYEDYPRPAELTPLYRHPSPAALRAAVIDAYERAAREVDACMIGFADDDSELIEIAAAIRKLKETK